MAKEEEENRKKGGAEMKRKKRNGKKVDKNKKETILHVPKYDLLNKHNPFIFPTHALNFLLQHNPTHKTVYPIKVTPLGNYCTILQPCLQRAHHHFLTSLPLPFLQWRACSFTHSSPTYPLTPRNLSVDGQLSCMSPPL